MAESFKFFTRSRRPFHGAEHAVPAPFPVSELKNRGSPMDAATRGEMEARFGFSFGAIRIHADPRAARMARSVDAKAFTVGEHVVFDEGRYDPASSAGKDLLIHELQHVADQRIGAAAPGPTLHRQDNDEDPPRIDTTTREKILASLERLGAAEQDRLRDAVVAMTELEYKLLHFNLRPEDHEKYASLLRDIEMIRFSGKTFEELGARQAAFVQEKAEATGVSSAEFLVGSTRREAKDERKAREGKAKARSQEEIDDNTDLLKQILEVIRRDAPPQALEALNAAEAAGGGIVYHPEETDDAGRYAAAQGDLMYVGSEWIVDGTVDPARIYPTLVHELGAHREYGSNASSRVMGESMRNLRGGRGFLRRDNQSVFDRFAYWETEIYAELVEVSFMEKHPSREVREAREAAEERIRTEAREDVEAERTRPWSSEQLTVKIEYSNYEEIESRLDEMKGRFEPEVGEALVRGLVYRVDHDPDISATAAERFRKIVAKVFPDLL